MDKSPHGNRDALVRIICICAPDAQFAHTVGFEVAEARRQGYGGALGYGFIVYERVAQAWNAAWEHPQGGGAWSKA